VPGREERRRFRQLGLYTAYAQIWRLRKTEHCIERRLLGGEVFEKLFVEGHRAAL
jgi:hypothetical protein